MPNDLRSWLDELATRSLPMLSSTTAELDEVMSNAQLSVMQYAIPILNDPGLTANLLKKANQDRTAAGRHPLTTMNNVMSHLGQGQLKQQQAQSKMLGELNLPDRNRQGYLRYVAEACHCACQARDWAELRGVNEPEEMYLAALLQNIAELALWCYGGDDMAKIEHETQVNKRSYVEAAKKVLGCSMRELGVALAERWCLSELTIDALKSDYKGFTLATGVALASRLAHSASSNWYDTLTRQCIEDIATYKGKAVGDVERRIHQNALAMTDDFVRLGYMPPARLLPMLADEQYVDQQFVFTDNVQSATAPVSESKQPEPTVVAERKPNKPVVKAPSQKDVTAEAELQPKPEPKTKPVTVDEPVAKASAMFWHKVGQPVEKAPPISASQSVTHFSWTHSSSPGAHPQAIPTVPVTPNNSTSLRILFAVKSVSIFASSAEL